MRKRTKPDVISAASTSRSQGGRATAGQNKPAKTSRAPSRTPRILIAGATMFAITATVAVVWPLSFAPSSRLTAAAAPATAERVQVPQPTDPVRILAVKVERSLDVALRQIEPAWQLDGITVASDRVDVRVCQRSGQCAALVLTDGRGPCATTPVGAFCVKWASSRPVQAAMVEAAIRAHPVEGTWVAAPWRNDAAATPELAANGAATTNGTGESQSGAGGAVATQGADKAWTSTQWAGDAPLALRLGIAAIVALIGTALISRRLRAH